VALLPIRTVPDPVLRTKCRPVERFDDELARLARDMVETMRAAPGVGLAANQIGSEVRLAVVDVSAGEDPDELLVLVNPEITAAEGRELDLEGCLSIPGLTDKVERAQSIEVTAQDLAGERVELAASGYLARAIQHEVDHLDGVLFVDRLAGLRKERARRFIRRLQEQAEVSA
jgi:peptide deformylase